MGVVASTIIDEALASPGNEKEQDPQSGLRLPPELIYVILRHVDNNTHEWNLVWTRNPTLWACALTCKWLYQEVTPRLYRYITIYDKRTAHDIQYTLTTRKDLAAHAEELFVCNLKGNYDSHTWLLQVLKAKPKLRQLTIATMEWTFLHSSFFMAARHFKELTRLCLSDFHIGSAAELTRVITCFPVLSTLYLDNFWFSSASSAVSRNGHTSIRCLYLRQFRAEPLYEFDAIQINGRHYFLQWLVGSDVARDLEELEVYFYGQSSEPAVGYSQSYYDTYTLLQHCRVLKRLCLQFRSSEMHRPQTTYSLLDAPSLLSLSTATHLIIRLPPILLEPSFSQAEIMKELASLQHFVSKLEACILNNLHIHFDPPQFEGDVSGPQIPNPAKLMIWGHLDSLLGGAKFGRLKTVHFEVHGSNAVFQGQDVTFLHSLLPQLHHQGVRVCIEWLPHVKPSRFRAELESRD